LWLETLEVSGRRFRWEALTVLELEELAPLDGWKSASPG
jgi:hypothetical protein